MVNLLGLTGTSGLKPRFHFESRLEHPMTTCWQDILRESKQLMAKQVPNIVASCCAKQCNGRSTFDWSLPPFHHVCAYLYIHVCITISAGILSCRGFLAFLHESNICVGGLGRNCATSVGGHPVLGHPVFTRAVPAYCLHPRSLQ